MAEQGIARLGQSALQFKQDIPMAGQVVSKFEQGISMVGQAISKVWFHRLPVWHHSSLFKQKLAIITAELFAITTTIHAECIHRRGLVHR